MNILVQRKGLKTRICRCCQQHLNEDPTQSQQILAEKLNVSLVAIFQRLKAMWKILEVWKMGATRIERQANGHQKTICEMLLQRFERKSFLHRIVTGDEKWIFFWEPEAKKSWLSPGEAALFTSKPNRFGRKTITYSPDLDPSDFHLFASMGHSLPEQHFVNFEEVEK
jgi:hypothetical protein